MIGEGKVVGGLAEMVHISGDMGEIWGDEEEASWSIREDSRVGRDTGGCDGWGAGRSRCFECY